MSGEQPAFAIRELIEAVEQRLPLGKHITRVVLVFAVLWFIVAAGRAIYDGSIGPVAARIDTGQLPDFEWSRLFAVAVPTAILGVAFWGIGRMLSRLNKRLMQLETQATETAVVETVTRRTTDEGQHIAYQALVQLRETAIRTLLNRPISSLDDLSEVKQQIDDWQEAVLSLLVVAGADAARISSFRVLGTLPRGLPGWNAEHAKELDMLAERLKRLEEALKYLQEEIHRKALQGLKAAGDRRR